MFMRTARIAISRKGVYPVIVGSAYDFK